MASHQKGKDNGQQQGSYKRTQRKSRRQIDNSRGCDHKLEDLVRFCKGGCLLHENVQRAETVEKV